MIQLIHCQCGAKQQSQTLSLTSFCWCHLRIKSATTRAIISKLQTVFIQLLTIIIFTISVYLPLSDSRECPNMWDTFYRTNSNFNICIRRLPETVTWYDGEQQCQDWMGNPLAWNETLNNLMNQRAFEITETGI